MSGTGGSAKGAAECSRVNFYGDLNGSIEAFRVSVCRLIQTGRPGV